MSNEFDALMNGTAGTTGTSEQGGGLVLDLGGVDENKPAFEAMPPGTYPAVVDNVEFKESSTGNPMLSWTFTITDAEYENRKVFFHTVLNKDAGLASLKRTLIRVLPDFPLGQFNPQSFADEGIAIGRDCRVKLNVRPYNGEKRNNVQDVLAPETGGDFL